ncbi:MAG TPA: tyrosine-type recombinase/integrase [Polyangiaceae bacterium]|nr:tyrosine-type recombinase/integrase [Polyangiaceae bacterium]
MGRRAEGWRIYWQRGWAQLRFRHEGKRHSVALGTRDAGEAARLAPTVYADFVAGRWRPTERVGGRPGALADLVAAWLDDYRAGRPGATADDYEGRWRAHLGPFFGWDFARITRASLKAYQTERLKVVTRKTLQKELSAYNVFVAWLVDTGAVAEEHAVRAPKLPRGALGTRDPVRGRKGRTDLSPAQVAAVLAALPETTPARRKGETVWCRPYFELLYETGLRPATLAALSTPEHWRPGARHLELPAELDKARFARRVPLTPRAVELLGQVAPKGGGLVFGRHDLRNALETACRAAGAPEVTPYDLRHARATHLVEAGASLAGVAHLLGHARVTTTAVYARSSERAGEAALQALSGDIRATTSEREPGAKGGT